MEFVSLLLPLLLLALCLTLCPFRFHCIWSLGDGLLKCVYCIYLHALIFCSLASRERRGLPPEIRLWFVVTHPSTVLGTHNIRTRAKTRSRVCQKQQVRILISSRKAPLPQSPLPIRGTWILQQYRQQRGHWLSAEICSTCSQRRNSQTSSCTISWVATTERPGATMQCGRDTPSRTSEMVITFSVFAGIPLVDMPQKSNRVGGQGTAPNTTEHSIQRVACTTRSRQLHARSPINVSLLQPSSLAAIIGFEKIKTAFCSHQMCRS